MIVIDKESNNKIRIKLNEGNTLEYTGGFIFEFVNNTSNEAIKVHLVDVSPYPISYNLFLLEEPTALELVASEYTLNLYASEEVTIDTTAKELVHTDFVKVFGESNTEIIYTP